MPQPTFPPTPASSTEIAGKSDIYTSQFDHSFALPPAALDAHTLITSTGTNANVNSGTSKNSSNLSSAPSSIYQPLSPSSPVNTLANGATAPCKRKANNDNVSCGDSINVAHDDWCSGSAKHSCTLPPPPTRSRKIIQMKPCTAQDKPTVNRRNNSITISGFSHTTTRQATIEGAEAKATAVSSAGTKTSNGNRAMRRKHSNDVAVATSAAGRRSARKTAHSIIERRRRSKMNEEFGVLKDMIPACAGQDMHKLAILQASIEYMRYLKHCITELQSNKQQQRFSATDVGSKKSSVCSLVAFSDINSGPTQKPFENTQQNRNRSIPCKDSLSTAHMDKEKLDNSIKSTTETSIRSNPDSDNGLKKSPTDTTHHPSAGRVSSLSSSNEICSPALDTGQKMKDFVSASGTTTNYLLIKHKNQQSYHSQLEQDNACSKTKSNKVTAKSSSPSPSSKKHEFQTVSTSAPYSLSALASAATLPSYPSTPPNIDHLRRLSLEPDALRQSGSDGMAASTSDSNKSHHLISSLCSPSAVAKTSSTIPNTTAIAACETPDDNQAANSMDVKDENIKAGVCTRSIKKEARCSMTDDQEATTALLMLNRAADSCGAGGRGRVRGMSVWDVLSG